MLLKRIWSWCPLCTAHKPFSFPSSDPIWSVPAAIAAGCRVTTELLQGGITDSIKLGRHVFSDHLLGRVCLQSCVPGIISATPYTPFPSQSEILLHSDRGVFASDRTLFTVSHSAFRTRRYLVALAVLEQQTCSGYGCAQQRGITETFDTVTHLHVELDFQIFVVSWAEILARNVNLDASRCDHGHSQIHIDFLMRKNLYKDASQGIYVHEYQSTSPVLLQYRGSSANIMAERMDGAHSSIEQGTGSSSRSA